MARRRGEHRPGVHIVKMSALPGREVYTVEVDGDSYIAIVLTDHPRRLDVVVSEKTHKEVRRTALRNTLHEALVKERV